MFLEKLYLYCCLSETAFLSQPLQAITGTTTKGILHMQARLQLDPFLTVSKTSDLSLRQSFITL